MPPCLFADDAVQAPAPVPQNVAMANDDAVGPGDDLNKRVGALETKYKRLDKLVFGLRQDMGQRYVHNTPLRAIRPNPGAVVPKNAKNLAPRKVAKATVPEVQPADGSTFMLPGESTKYARKVHFLIYAFESDPAIGAGAQANADFLESLATKFDSFEADRVTVKRSNSFSESSIADDIRGMADVQTTDAIFCYISTHGTYSSKAGHSILMTDGSTVVPRSNIFTQLKSHDARLTVFITDSCANFAPGAAGFPSASTHPTTPTYVLLPLLYKFVGNLNMNGASPDPDHTNADGSLGEEGFYLTNSSTRGGGIATRAFIKEAVFGSSQNWVQFYNNWRAGTELEGKAVPTPLQTPAVFNESGIWVH